MEPVGRRLQSVLGMLAMRPGWRAGFDVSGDGLVRSFLAAALAVPLFILSIVGQNRIYGSLAETEAAANPVGLPQGVILYLCLWIYFPIVARVFTRAFHIEESFAPWVVVHNWTVLFLLCIQGGLGALVLVGALTPAVYLDLGGFYFLFAIYAHSRAAVGALNAPWPLAIGAACCGVLVWLILQLILVRMFAGAALQA